MLKNWLAAAVAAVIVNAPANAALVTYDMVFTDQAGADVGTGYFSYDTEVFQNVSYVCGSIPFCEEQINPLLAWETSVPGFNTGLLGSTWVDDDGFLVRSEYGKGVGAPSLTYLLFYGNSLYQEGSIRGNVNNGGAWSAFNDENGQPIPSAIPRTGSITFTERPIVTPLPAAAWLMISGVLGLIGLSRRRR